MGRSEAGVYITPGARRVRPNHREVRLSAGPNAVFIRRSARRERGEPQRDSRDVFRNPFVTPIDPIADSLPPPLAPRFILILVLVLANARLRPQPDPNEVRVFGRRVRRSFGLALGLLLQPLGYFLFVT